MQREILEKGKLLDENGNLTEKGFARKYLLEYNRENVATSTLKIKEWDYYYIGNDDYALCLTVADMGYIGALSATVIDFKNRRRPRLCLARAL